MLLSNNKIQKLINFNSLAIIITGCTYAASYFLLKEYLTSSLILLLCIPQFIIIKIFYNKFNLEYQIIAMSIFGCFVTGIGVFTNEASPMLFIGLLACTILQSIYLEIKYWFIHCLIANFICIYGLINRTNCMPEFPIQDYLTSLFCLNFCFGAIYYLIKVSSSSLSKSMKSTEKAKKLNTQLGIKMEETEKLLKRQQEMINAISLSSLNLTSSSKELAQIVKTTTEGANTQASAIQELASAVYEISDKTRDNATYAESLLQISKQTSLDVKFGQINMNGMQNAMQKIQVSSSEIQSIMEDLDELAFLTNILSLNAIIESARAGEAGLCFASLSQDVQAVAIKCSKAAEKTSDLIESTVSAVKRGSVMVDKTSKSMTNIIEKTQKSSKIVLKVFGSSESQVKNIDQISDGINQISQVTQQNAAAAEETSTASQMLYKESKELNKLTDISNN